MITVSLNDLKFEAFHGIHEEEKIIGNSYVVNCSIELHEGPEVIRHIDDTVDYSRMYEIIRERMNEATPLLETVCMEMGNRLHDAFPEARSVLITIRKLHPPIEGFSGSSSVSWHKEY